ncbi:MAG: guanylate kinase [Syntrophomonadaceae bacterium]|nr:guanylate kinase [Syntrophomonadaceae bacterium]
MNRKGILFVISGPSGVGKGTIRETMMKKPISNLTYSISATTRKPRAGEIDGRDYFFFETGVFESAIAQGEFLEWALVYDNYYGTPKQYVFDCLEKGQDILLEIDIQGALKTKRLVPDGVFVFVMPPSFEEIRQRLLRRGKDTCEEVERRLQSYEEEMSCIGEYEYVIINDDVNIAAEALRAIIIGERCKVKRIQSRGC